MKKYLLFICLAINFGIYAQIKEISFREISKITDKEKFELSLKEYQENFKESLKKSLLNEERNKEKENQIV